MVRGRSTVTASFARKLQAPFACKGIDYGGGGGDGDRRRVVVAGKDSCSAATTWPIGAPCPGAWIFSRELKSRALGDGSIGGSGGSGGSGAGIGGGVSIGRGSWSLTRAVVCVVIGVEMFSHQNYFHGSLLFEPLPPHDPAWKLVFADPNLNAQSLHCDQQPLQTLPPNAMNAN